MSGFSPIVFQQWKRSSDPGGCARDQAHPLHGMGESQDATTHDGVGKVENPEVTGSWQLADAGSPTVSEELLGNARK
jgi:hypothetical protein